MTIRTRRSSQQQVDIAEDVWILDGYVMNQAQWEQSVNGMRALRDRHPPQDDTYAKANDALDALLFQCRETTRSCRIS